MPLFNAGRHVQDTRVERIRQDSPSLGRDRAGARAAAYCALAAGLLLLFMAIRGADWTVSGSLPRAFELAAALIALVVGILALVRYYSRKNDTLLLIGSAMIGVAVLDTYHLFVTTGVPFPLMPAQSRVTEPWSWFSSRMFMSIMMLWSFTAWRRENRTGERGLSELRIYFEVGAITLLSIALFGLVSLPAAIRPTGPIPRPFELLPGALFATATIGYLSKGNWRKRPFEVWLIPALIVSAAIQWLFIPFSTSPVDAWATVSHVLKLLSYGYILIGLVASMFGLYRRLERAALHIEHSNEALRGEIDDRKSAEAAARRSEERYRTILETIQEGYFEVDLAGNFVFWNESLADLLGYHPERLGGLNYRAYTRDPQSAAVFETFSQVYRTGQPVKAFGWEIVRPDGTRRYAEASAGPVRGEKGEIVGFRGIVRDVTQRRTAEERLETKSRELARSTEELRQFASVASQDLLEPLRAVAGYTQLLARKYRGKLDGEADIFIRHSVEGIARMQRVLRDLIDYTRVHTHGRRFELVELDGVLAGTLASLRPAIEEAGATITSDPLPEVEADPTQMSQLLTNLIANAIKFRGERPPAIHVGAAKRPGEWLVTIRDNGVGVDPEERARIFEIFQRAHPRETHEGTGIGLAICRRIVERHGGRIWVEPTPAQGATFALTLRRASAAAEPTAASCEAPSPDDAPNEPGETETASPAESIATGADGVEQAAPDRPTEEDPVTA